MTNDVQRYQDWRLLGKGGTAEVFRVLDAELGDEVAIKILKPELLREHRKRMMDSLRAEVRISRRLRHTSICPIHELYDGPQGVGVVMDIIDGAELRDWMNDNATHLLDTTPQRLNLLVKLADALRVAHREIVHRDLKPQNVFLRDNDISQPVIMDFGCSIIGQSTDADSTVGYTPKYMAPEQYLTPDRVDRRADLWALGIMAYELFTNRVPDCSLRYAPRTSHVPRLRTDQITPPSSFNAAVPPALDSLILQLLEYDPDRRIQSADDLAPALARITLRDHTQAAPGDQSRAAGAITLEGGTYYIGSPPAGTGRPNERPARRITLGPFSVDPGPVTNADFRRFCDSTGHAAPPLLNHPVFGRLDHPVVAVTHADALAFAQWAGGQLPTEAQWEYAARGGVQFADYPWGGGPPLHGDVNIDGARPSTSPIGAYPAGRNGFGLEDMCGNVWEWCLDTFDEGFYRTITAESLNPVCARPGPAKVIRGGSFESLKAMGRCAFRASAAADERRQDLGFRLVYRVE